MAMPDENLEPIFMHLVGQITADTDPHEFAARLVTLLGGHVSILIALDLQKALTAALRSYGEAQAAQERERIEKIVRGLRYDDEAIRARDNGDEYYAETGFEQAQAFILAALTPPPTQE